MAYNDSGDDVEEEHQAVKDVLEEKLKAMLLRASAKTGPPAAPHEKDKLKHLGTFTCTIVLMISELIGVVWQKMMA